MLLALGQFLGTLIIAAGALQIRSATEHFVSPSACRFEFDHPRDWIVEQVDKEPCTVRVRPRDFAAKLKQDDDVDLYTLEVGVGGDFLATAGEQFFDFVKGRWVILGRTGMTAPARVIVTERWSGLRGVAPTGCYHERGGYAGLCEQPVLVLRGEDQVWWMRGGPQSDAVFNRILETFRFTMP